MSYSSGEAAEQVVRMTLNGVEVAAKISGKAAERLAVLLYAVLKDQKKTRGKTRLNSMLRSGKELKVFAIGDRDLEKFCREAKRYGILCFEGQNGKRWPHRCVCPRRGRQQDQPHF